MRLVRNKGHNRVRRKERTGQSSQIRVTVDVKIDAFGTVRSNDTIYFESGVKPEQLGRVVVPAATPVDEVIDHIGNAVVLG